MEDNKIGDGLYHQIKNGPYKVIKMDREEVEKVFNSLFSEQKNPNRTIKLPWKYSFYETLKRYQEGFFGLKPMVKWLKKEKKKEYVKSQQ